MSALGQKRLSSRHEQVSGLGLRADAGPLTLQGRRGPQADVAEQRLNVHDFRLQSIEG